ERRAAKKSREALAKGDMAEAQLQKQRQLVSFHLYQLAREASDRLDKMNTRWKRYSSSATTRAKIGAQHIEQIDAILDQIELGRPQFEPSQSLQEWAEALSQEGNDDLL